MWWLSACTLPELGEWWLGFIKLLNNLFTKWERETEMRIKDDAHHVISGGLGSREVNRDQGLLEPKHRGRVKVVLQFECSKEFVIRLICNLFR